MPRCLKVCVRVLDMCVTVCVRVCDVAPRKGWLTFLGGGKLLFLSLKIKLQDTQPVYNEPCCI